MDDRAFEVLSGTAGRALLARLATVDLGESQTLALLDDLRHDLPPDIAGAALTLARLRIRAVSKFSRADSMFFTADGLEQASGEGLSAWRARRLAAGGGRWIADLGCGIGGDTLALAAAGNVIALDRDALRLKLARANLGVYDRAARFVQADLTDPLPLASALAGVEAAFFDPARREAGKRIFSVRDYAPPLDVITGWGFRALAVKLSPGVNLDELHAYAGAGIEFVSLGGDLKEAVLWAGEMGFTGRWASRLEPDGSGETLKPGGLPAPLLSAPRAYLYEPDPAVIRAGLLSELADRLGVDLFRLDDTIAYLTGDEIVRSGWARIWPVLDWMPFNLKRLRAALREQGVGRVTVKKRGSPLTPDDLARRLKLGGAGEERVVVLTRIAGQHSVLICGPML